MSEKTAKLVVIATLVGLLLFQVSPTSAQEEIIMDTFDNPELPGWERSPNAKVVDGILIIEPDGFAIRPGEWDDLELNVIARQRGESYVVINYRLSELGDYALLVGSDEIRLSRAGNPLAQNFMEPFPANEWFSIQVHVEGKNHEIMVNNQPVISAQDPDPLPPGGIALATQGIDGSEYQEITILSFEVPLTEDEPGTEPGEEPAPPEVEPLPTTEFRWVRTGGPPGGLGYDIRYNFDNPNTWYVTDNFAGVHISTDNGLTWLPSNEGIPGQYGPTGDGKPIFCLTVDPHDPQIIWAGTDKTGHIYKSTDGGVTWSQKDDGVIRQTGEYDALTFRGFTVDPVNSEVVYAMAEIANTSEGGANVWSTANGGKVYKTSDGGDNWTLIWNGGIPSSLARYMWINPEDTEILYVSTGIFDRGAVNEKDPLSDPDPYGGLGVLKSSDGGETWRVLNEANGLNSLYIGSLYMHPDDPDILLAAAGKPETELFYVYRMENDLTLPAGVYRTIDGGESWTHVLVGGGANVVEFCPSNPDFIYAADAQSVHRSEDAGQTWKRVSEKEIGWGPPGVLAGTPIDFQCDPRDPNRVFANNYLGGNFLSEDGGKTWKNASDGYTGAQIVSVAVDPQNAAQVYVGGRTGLWGSKDGGTSWHGLRYPPTDIIVEGFEFGAIAVDPKSPNHLLANGFTGIWESFDYGSSWEVRQRPVEGLDNPNIEGGSNATIAFAPSDTNIVYTGIANTICLVNAEAYCLDGSGVFKSQDGGKTWGVANDANIADQAVIAIAVDPADAQRVYVGSQRGLFKTTDGGTSWRLLAGLPADTRVDAITIHPQDSSQLLVGVEGQGLFSSTDGGENWQMIAAGLQPNNSIRGIRFDPTNPQIVYLSDLMSGVYRSTDGGRTWAQINNDLTNRSTTGLAISSDGQHVYVATNGEGAFRLDVNGQPPVGAVDAGTSPTHPEVPPEQESGGSNLPCPGSAFPLLLVGAVWSVTRKN